MVDWTTPLPDTAQTGDTGHVEDHNSIVASISEVRTAVDTVETAASTAQSTADSAASAASTAQSTADSAASAASTAQSTADAAATQAAFDLLETRVASLEANAA